jgi:hypothetical protein
VAIYQAPRRRWRVALAAGLAGLIVGIGTGLVVAHHGQSTTAQVITTFDADLEDVAGVLGVLEVEYHDATQANASEMKGVTDALASARRRYAALRPAVRALDAATDRRIEDGFLRLGSLIEGHRPAQQVGAEVRSLARMLHDVVGR